MSFDGVSLWWFVFWFVVNMGFFLQGVRNMARGRSRPFFEIAEPFTTAFGLGAAIVCMYIILQAVNVS